MKNTRTLNDKELLKINEILIFGKRKVIIMDINNVRERFNQEYNNLINVIKGNKDYTKGYVLSNNAVRLLNLLCSEITIDRVLIPNLGHGELALCPEKATAFSESPGVIKVVKEIVGKKDYTLVQKDFLKVDSIEDFSTILLFPPLDNYSSVGRKDIAYIKKCLDVLPKNGKLILLARQNFLSAPAFKGIRERILKEFSLEAVIYLDKVGRAIGTESSVLIIRKNAKSDKIQMLNEVKDADLLFNDYVYGAGFFVDTKEVYDRIDANYYDPWYKKERELIQRRDTVKISGIADIFQGCFISSEERKESGDYLIIRPQYICNGSLKVNNNKRIFCDKSFVTKSDHANHCMLKKDDILVSLMGNISWAIYDGDEKYAIANQHVAIIRGKNEYKKWFNLFFSTRTGIEYLESQLNFLRHSASFDHISVRNLSEIYVPDIKVMQDMEKINKQADREAKVVSLFSDLGWEAKLGGSTDRFDIALFDRGNLRGVVDIKNYSSPNVVNNAVLAKQLGKIKDCVGNVAVYLFIDNEIYEYEDGRIIQLPELPRPGKPAIKKTIKSEEDSKQILSIEKNDIEEKSITDSVIQEIIARGFSSLQTSIDRIEGRIIDISAKLDQLLKQITGYQSLVEKQLALAVSQEEKERIIYAFSEECVERIKNEIGANNASREYNTELQKLILTFGESTWNKMEESSRSFLVSSKIAFNNLINIENNVDYSGVCLLVTKALEVELSKRFGNNFINYLKQKYPGRANYSQFPTALLNTFYDTEGIAHKKPIRPKEFTLGRVAYVLCLCHAKGIEDKQKVNNEKKLIEYAQEVLCNDKNDEEILEILKDFAQSVEDVKERYRNPSAHTNQVKKVDAEECFNLVVDVEKLLKRILDAFKA